MPKPFHLRKKQHRKNTTPCQSRGFGCGVSCRLHKANPDLYRIRGDLQDQLGMTRGILRIRPVQLMPCKSCSLLERAKHRIHSQTPWTIAYLLQEKPKENAQRHIKPMISSDSDSCHLPKRHILSAFGSRLTGHSLVTWESPSASANALNEACGRLEDEPRLCTVGSDCGKSAPTKPWDVLRPRDTS